MTSERLELLPEQAECLLCKQVKPRAELIVVRMRKQNVYRLKPRCKECHNARERGYRREWKRKYLQDWRRRNPVTDRSYRDNDYAREQARIRQARIIERDHDALLIQGRMRRYGYPCTIAEAREYLRNYGRCYPTRYGLTKTGMSEAERIRRQFKPLPKHRRPTNVEIRMMVYDDGNAHFVVKPDKQPVPYQKAAARLRQWQAERRRAKEVSA